MAYLQPELTFDSGLADESQLSVAQRADLWMHSKGGRMIMRDLYALAARYVNDWKCNGIPVSIALIYELQRHKMKKFRSTAQRLGIEVPKTSGYRMSNSHRAYIARHMMERRPEWKGLFEIRQLDDETKEETNSND